jgi:hypothetical protein
MPGTKSQGTRVYRAANNVSWTAVSAGSYPTTGFTEVSRGISIDPKGDELEKFDDSTLNDTSPLPGVITKPSGLTFTREKDSGSAALLALCDGGATTLFWAVVYVDGTAQTCLGYLTCTSPGRASKGFANKVEESYEVVATTKWTTRAAA